MQFLAADVEKITGVKRQRLEQWLSRGFIAPSIQAASGHGSRNIWSRNDLYTIALFKKITESGLSRKMVSDFLSAGIVGRKKVNDVMFMLYMRKEGKRKGSAIYFKKGEDIVLHLDDIQTDLNMHPFDDVFIVNFIKLRVAIDKKIEEAEC